MSQSRSVHAVSVPHSRYTRLSHWIILGAVNTLRFQQDGFEGLLKFLPALHGGHGNRGGDMGGGAGIPILAWITGHVGAPGRTAHVAPYG